MEMEQTERSETSTYKIQTPGNYPEEKHTAIKLTYVPCNNAMFFTFCILHQKVHNLQSCLFYVGVKLGFFLSEGV